MALAYHHKAHRGGVRGMHGGGGCAEVKRIGQWTADIRCALSVSSLGGKVIRHACYNIAAVRFDMNRREMGKMRRCKNNTRMINQSIGVETMEGKHHD